MNHRPFTLIRADEPVDVADTEAASERPNKEYVTNAAGQPEFASVILTMDHMTDSDPFHVHQKVLYGTETADAALASIVQNYYKDANLSGSGLLVDAMIRLRDNPVGVVVAYVVPARFTDRFGGSIVQAVMSTRTLNALTASPEIGRGSSLVAMDRLVAMLYKAIPQVKGPNDSTIVAPLTVLEFDFTPQRRVPVDTEQE